ncbi:MAG: hypothetical protein WAV32_03805 [Halobacteriota archaeon]
MTGLEALKTIFIVAAITLAFVAAGSAYTDYSYNLTTTGGTMIAEESHSYLSVNDYGGMENQYSLGIDAAHARSASCNHTFSESNDEIRSSTNATYSHATNSSVPILITGAGLTENIGGASTGEGGNATATLYDAAIGFTTSVSTLERFSSDGLGRTGSDTYYNVSAAEGTGSFKAGVSAIELTKQSSASGWDLTAKDKTYSRVGVKSGSYMFNARYHVKRSG